jgi:hypothetical protein
MEQIKNYPICDFCSATPVVAAFIAKPFATAYTKDGHTLVVDYDQKWAACETCARLVREKQRDTLLKRSTQTLFLRGRSFPLRMIEAFYFHARKEIGSLHERFWEGFQGECAP